MVKLVDTPDLGSGAVRCVGSSPILGNSLTLLLLDFMLPNLPSTSQLTVFKGGTAFNGILRAFQQQFPKTTYVVPITDNGGSSREVGRVFGGPSIGDLRSTLTRLSDESTLEACAVKKLLEHRLHLNDSAKAKAEWHTFLEDTHPFYEPISIKYKSLIRSFLFKFEEERLQRLYKNFDMRNGSIGNFFFTGARLKLGSLETAVFMYSSAARIPATTHVVPIIDSNDRLSIAAKLDNGTTLIGQHAISHPNDHGRVVKCSYNLLPAPVKELFYVNKFNNSINPKPNPGIIKNLYLSNGVIYGMGSLWTSIIPSLILEGVGEAVASVKGPKIALLNCCNDRETSGLSALDYINRITDSLNRYGALSNFPQAYITHLMAIEDGEIAIDEKEIRKLGIEVIYVPQDPLVRVSMQDKLYPIFSSQELINAIIKKVQ